MIYYIGFGSNLGEREYLIRRAIRLMEQQLGKLLGEAPLNYSQAVGFASEHEFCNTVALYESAFSPQEVLTCAQSIEQQLGRPEHKAVVLHGKREYTDRLIDIDILMAYDEGLDVQMETPTLTLPHPQMQMREFVQQPLRELIDKLIADATLSFVKMHGLGNDYIYFDCTGSSQAWLLLPVVTTYAPLLCDRHRGIGGDGLVFILPDKKADLRMRIFNADGSEAEMCGNAARCVGYYAVCRHLVKSKRLRLATKGGERLIEVKDREHISVHMGKPADQGTQTIDERTYHCVDIGNPHAVTLLTDNDALTKELVHTVGPQVENNPLFPNRTNVEFCVVIDRHHVAMRVWERGSGETQACGTGATATAYACIRQGLCASPVTVTLLGGNLTIALDGEEAIMTGEATIAYTGTITINGQMAND
ncbi:MAG: diaminopimelate epimerase [Paludibacteraceae bacterium]|nr:diaminopimelate epimerase [Paludibacteraceae bacterium]